jgi:hypothetical protein
MKRALLEVACLEKEARVAARAEGDRKGCRHVVSPGDRAPGDRAPLLYTERLGKPVYSHAMENRPSFLLHPGSRPPAPSPAAQRQDDNGSDEDGNTHEHDYN